MEPLSTWEEDGIAFVLSRVAEAEATFYVVEMKHLISGKTARMRYNSMQPYTDDDFQRVLRVGLEHGIKRLKEIAS